MICKGSIELHMSLDDLFIEIFSDIFPTSFTWLWIASVRVHKRSKTVLSCYLLRATFKCLLNENKNENHSSEYVPPFRWLSIKE